MKHVSVACRVQHRRESRSSFPPPAVQLASTSQGQDTAVSHTRLQLPRLELLIEPATVSCLTRLLALMPESTVVTAAPGKHSCNGGSCRNSSAQLPWQSLQWMTCYSTNALCCNDAEEPAQLGRSSFQLLAEGLLVRLQHDGSSPATAAEPVACVLSTEAVGVVLNTPRAAVGRLTCDQSAAHMYAISISTRD